MKLLGVLSWLVLLAGRIQATNNNLTDLVEWDPHSLTINGSRVFIWSAEFHYQRLPIPELWLDVFQKFRASGFNAISVYFFWSYHSPVKDVFDFETGGHEIQRLFDYAQQAGLYVIARAGPYDNAETSGGGLALHLSDGSGGRLRTSDETYYQSWLPWIEKIGKIIADNSITKGGPVILNQIENELTETVHQADHTLVIYMEQIKKAFRDAGVIVPFTSNEKGMRGQSWSTDYQNVGGAVDVYGLDSYPGGTSCTNSGKGYSVVRTYYQWFQNYSFTQPQYLPEFEGGWFQPWGGSNYDDCPTTLSPQFADLYYKNNVGQRVTLQNIYMAFGGTNWGHSAAPVVFTSYDYSAPLRESREIRDKLSQAKLIGLFTRVSKDLLHNIMEGNGTGYTSDQSIYSWVLRNTETGAGFYVLNHATSSSRESTTFSLDVNTSAGAITIPNINLNGRQSKIVVTDYNLSHSILLYCAVDIASYGTFGPTDVVVLYSEVGQRSSFAFKGGPEQTFKTYGADANVSSSGSNGTISYAYTQPAGTSVISFANGTTIYLLDTKTAYRFWAPPTTPDPQVSPSEQIFVLGPYLVRRATLEGSTVAIVGDNDNSTTIEVYAGPVADSITWNGEKVNVTKTPYGSLVGSVIGATKEPIELPELTNWQAAESLPEIQPSYDDSKWTICNKTSTLNPIRPLTLPVLYASDYGYYTGVRIYRGRFDGTSVTGANLTASGGLAFGWNVWLNGKLVSAILGDPANTTSSTFIDFRNQTLLPRDNLLTVVIDYTGHDQTSTAQGVLNPRGLLGATLNGGTGAFTSWRIQGNAGGASGAYALDPVRAPMNEGGLLAERLGWHLPSFDPATVPAVLKNFTTFSTSSPVTDGLTTSGVKFYLTTFDLSLPSNHDIPLAIAFTAAPSTIARIQLFINGYQYGKYVPHIGPQTVFPISPGILNGQGKNTLGLTVWAQTAAGAKLEGVKIVSFGGSYRSGLVTEGLEEGLSGFDGQERGYQPGWRKERLEFA